MTIRVLSPTEARVARLAAADCSDLEVADALGLTRDAVERHLSQVSRKLGARSRAELPGLLDGAPGRGPLPPAKRSISPPEESS
jgi:FixJ family two-component response regulator